MTTAEQKTATNNDAKAVTATPAAAAVAVARKSVTVVLETPIQRGAESIKSIQLLKPRTGDLRGLSLHDVTLMKTDSVAELLPRITVPSLFKHEIAEMDVADLINCAVEITVFFASRADMERPNS